MIRLAGLASMLVERKLSEYDFETFKKFVDISVSKPSLDYDMGSGGLSVDVYIKSTKDAPFRYKYNKRGLDANFLSGGTKIDINNILNTIYKTDFSKKTTKMK
jgi:hypothetical protein